MEQNIDDAIHEAIVNHILNIYTNRTNGNGGNGNSFISSNVGSRYYNPPPNGGYVVNEEHEYLFTDSDDLSSLVFLDVATRFGSPGTSPPEKLFQIRRNKIKNIGKYRKVKENDSILDTQCPICIDSFCCGEYQRTLECNHVFHKKCIDKWFKKDKNECPMCRTVIIN